MVADHQGGRHQSGIGLDAGGGEQPGAAAAVRRAPRRRAIKRIAAGAIALVAAAPAATFAAEQRCGELVVLDTHGATTTRYALARPPAGAPAQPPIAVVLLAGGGGHLDLDAHGCARALTGNFLVRSLAHFHALGFATALVDAPSDHVGEEALAGVRASPQHADDLGKVIADVRARTGAQVWLIGTSRGTISAANAAARLAGNAAPDGLVLTAAISAGGAGRSRPWLRQTVFDLALDAIPVPVLVVGHADDGCIRTPPQAMAAIAARLRAARVQVVTVTGGSGATGAGLEACQGRTAHGFLGQEAEVAAGIGRFVRGGRY